MNGEGIEKSDLATCSFFGNFFDVGSISLVFSEGLLSCWISVSS